MPEYRERFRGAEAVIILTDTSIRHSLNFTLSREHELDEYPDGMELQIRTRYAVRSLSLKRVSVGASGGGAVSARGCLIMLLNFRYRAMEGGLVCWCVNELK